jgi:hypothetical protein
MPEIGTYSLSGGRRLARQRASSDPTGHAANELLVGAQSKSNERQVDSEMRGDHNNAIEAAPELPAEAGCKKKKTSLRRVKCFYLTSPFIEPAVPAQSKWIAGRPEIPIKIIG